MTSPSYGAGVRWEPAKPRFRPLRLLLSWAVAAASLYVAAAVLPGVDLEGRGGAFVVAAARGDRQRGAAAGGGGAAAAVHARARLPARAGRRRARAGARRRAAPRVHRGRLVRRRAARGAGDGGRLDRASGRARHERRRRVHAARRPADRAPPGRREAAPTVPGIIFLEIDGLALPVLRDAMRDGSAPNDGALGRRGRLPPRRVGARPLLADGREPGGHPARVERGHPGFPVGGEGDRDG